MSIDFWKLDGTRFSTLPDLVSYNGYVKDANGDVYETKANSGIVSKKQFTYNLTANSSWLSGSGNVIASIAIGSDGSFTAAKVNLDDRYFTEDEIRANYIPWDTRSNNGTGGGFYRNGDVFINGNGYSDLLTTILSGIKSSISGLGSIYARTGDCYTKAESNEKFALKTALDKKQDKLGFTPIEQGGGTLQDATKKIRIGWSGTELRCEVEKSDKGAIAFKKDLSDGKITINQGGTYKGSFTLNGGGTTINLDAGGATGNASGTQGWIKIGNILVQWLKISTGRETPYPYGTYASPPLGFYSFCSQNYHITADCSDYSGILQVSTDRCYYDQDGDNRYRNDISVLVLGVAAS